MNTWSLRNEIFTITHRWPVVLLFCMFGCLLGWGASFLWPTPHQAMIELNVALNIYRWRLDRNAVKFANNEEFNYPDDYKNWQMANLNVLVTSDEVLRETLNRLRQEDSYWLNVNREQLSKMLRVYWRNAGLWRLVAEHERPKYATQAVIAWQNVILEILGFAIYQSQNTLQLDMQLQAIIAQQVQLDQQRVRLENLRAQTDTWLPQVAKWATDQPVNSLDRWRIWSMVAGAADLTPAWQPLLQAAPPEDALPEAYLSWLKQVQVFVEEQLKAIQVEAQANEMKRADVSVQYDTASKRSRGFSPNMIVERVSGGPPELSMRRPAPLVALIGGIFGLMAWLLFWVGRLAWGARAQRAGSGVRSPLHEVEMNRG